MAMNGGRNPWGGNGSGGGQQGPRNTPPRPDLEDWLRNAQEKMRQNMNGSGGNSRLIALAAIAGLMLWGFSGMYTVAQDEQGIVLRFGKYHRTTGPGLHYHLPSPIEAVYRPKVTIVNTEEIGFTSRGQGSARDMIPKPQESLMLTGDRNIVDIKFVVQWQIDEADKFLFNLRNPYLTVRNAAESAMREVIGQTPLAEANTQGRERIAQQTKNLLQEIMDSYHSGIRIVNLNVQSVEPPARVIEAFKDVLSASQDKERAINEAEAYRNDILPKARGLAEKDIQEAIAYRAQVVNEAQGKSDRFNALYKEYRLAPEVTKTRLYLDTMEQVMQDSRKVVVDDELKGVVPFLPLDRLK